MNLTYLNCILSGGLLIILAAVLFWGLALASVVTAAMRKRTLTHCLLAVAWAITLLACWSFTHWMRVHLVRETADVTALALCLATMLTVPMWHLIGSAVAVLLWILLRPGTFAKPTTIALLVVIFFAGLFNAGAGTALGKWGERISTGTQTEQSGARTSR